MSSLEASITLDDVFVVVGAKRVPLAPELAGYLSLEIAEGAGATSGDVDPRSVYIGEEGSVALVRRREPAADRGAPRADAPSGDASSSIRGILARLLDASGSQTVALAGVARRKPEGGLPILVEELEAALIPVNRAAGRRALARLAREVKRVTQGVGRNATLAPNEPARRGSAPSHAAVREPAPPSAGPARSAPVGDAAPPRREPTPAPPPVASVPEERISELPDSGNLPTRELQRTDVAASLAAHAAPAPRDSSPAPSGRDEVDHLLASFGVSSGGERVASRELKALVGLEPTPPLPRTRDSAPRASDAEVETLLAMSEPGPPGEVARSIASPPTAISPILAGEAFGEQPPRSAATPPTLQNAGAPLPSVIARDATPERSRAPRSEGAPKKSAAREAPTAPSMRRVSELSGSEFRQPRAPKTDRALTLIALVVLGGGAAALYLLRPSFFAGHPPVTSSRPTPASSAPSSPLRCRESLVVTGAPTNAEILLRVGQAPVDVEKMPVGARLELVATAEGYAPKRAVVPAGAAWDPGQDGKPRYEVAVQLDKSRARGAVDPWPPGEPGSEVGGKGSPGTVHLVSTPRGAEVWLLAGLGPEAHIDDLPCAGDVDVLVAGPSTLRRRLHVAKADFVSADGGPDKKATVSAR